jgi:ornithine carbamoyltransferase
MWNVKTEVVPTIVRATGIRQNHAENVCKTYLKSTMPVATENGDSGHCTVVMGELLT